MIFIGMNVMNSSYGTHVDKGLQYRFVSSAATFDIEGLTILIRQKPFRWVNVSHVPYSTMKLLFSGVSLAELIDSLSSDFDLPALLSFLHKLQKLDFFGEPNLTICNKNIPLVFFQITGKCNLACDYCYNTLDIRDCELTFEDIVQAYNLLKKRVDFASGVHIHFHGGEPLCNWETMRRAILFFRNNISSFCKISFTTNATLLQSEIVDFIRDNDVEVRISLDGLPEIHDKYRHTISGEGTYDKVISNYLLFGNYSKIVFLNTITNDNVSAVDKIIGNYRRLKVPAVVFRPFYKMGYALNNDNISISCESYCSLIKYLVDNVQLFIDSNIEVRNLSYLLFPFITKDSLHTLYCGNHCAAYSNSFFITSSGHVTGCDLLPNDPTYQVGNIACGVIDSVKCDYLARQLNGYSLSCQACPWKSICGGGCAALARLSASKKNKFLCELNHLVYPYLIRRLIDNGLVYRTYFDRYKTNS